MALRDLVLGGGACAVPGSDGASSSNPLGGLVENLIGGASKTQDRLKELPRLAGPGQLSTDFGGRPLTSLPGSEYENELDPRATAQGSSFLQNFGKIEDGGFADAWGDALNGRVGPPINTFPPGQELSVRDFQSFMQEAGSPIQQQLNLDAPPQRVLSGFLRSFLDSSRGEAPFHAVRLPELGLSEADKRRIRDRSSIMARHFFANRGDEYVNAQVSYIPKMKYIRRRE